MNRLCKSALFLVFLFVFFSYPLPRDLAKPWRFRLAYSVIFNSVDLVLNTGLLLGLYDMDTRIEISRTFRKIVFTAPPESSASLKVFKDTFDGVDVTVYDPLRRSSDHGIIYFHGGGWIMGDTDSYDAITRKLSNETGLLLISVNYRKLPQHLFPTQIEDCFKVVRYAMSKAESFKISPNKIIFAGDSAGGHLVFTVSYYMMQHYKHLPKPFHLISIYPITQAIDFRTGSHLENGNILLDRSLAAFSFHYSLHGNISTERMHVLLRNAHLPEKNRQQLSEIFGYEITRSGDVDDQASRELQPFYTDPFISPVLYNKMENLPPVFLITCAFDILRDDGYILAKRLKDKGAILKHKNYRTHHMMLNLEIIGLPEGQEMMSDIISYTKKLTVY